MNILPGQATYTTRHCLALLALCSALFLPNAGHADQPVLRILPLGNSITQAEINRASYRYPLWKKLIDADINFDFVGSMNTQQDRYSKGVPPQPDYRNRTFDPDHEGHFGWEASDIVKGRNPGNGTGSGNLAQWLKAYDFDIALLHLGTNDVFKGQSKEQIGAELGAVIDLLRNDNPNAIILLAQLIPTARDEKTARGIHELNQSLPALAAKLSTENSPVKLVDQFSDFNPGADSYDGIHPNASGEEKMAQRWFDAIDRMISNKPG